MKEDLTGQKFNRLTVIEKTDKRQCGYVVYRCKCDCGEITEVTSHNLKSGHTKSCGCLNAEKLAERNARKEFEVGQRFGRLTILGKAEKTRARYFSYRCRCDCGNEVIVCSADLKNGHTKSCGCLHRDFGKIEGEKKSLVGQQFGLLTVLERTNKRTSDGQAVYKCKCECGNITEAYTGQLQSGKRVSCGCVKSKGEMRISQILQENNILFETQKTFDDCRNPLTNAKFIFDFFVNDKYIIEYDGIQHFKTLGGWQTEEKLLKTQDSDRLKNEYCKSHGIPIIRIPYTKYDTLTLNDLLLERSL